MNELTIQKAQKLADVYGRDIIIGIRPNGKGFFATVNNSSITDRIERDGATIEEAVDALYEYTLEAYKHHVHSYTSAIKEAQKIVDKLS